MKGKQSIWLFDWSVVSHLNLFCISSVCWGIWHRTMAVCTGSRQIML